MSYRDNINAIEVNEPEENYRSGWVSIYRSVMNKGWYKKSEYVHLWVHLLLTANRKKTEFWFNGKNVVLQRGQLITGRKALSVNSGISESKVERILKTFENEQQIEQQTTNRNRLITVLNYDSYQQSEQPFEQQANNKRTTSEQQVNTYNKYNNINKEDNKPPIVPQGKELIFNRWLEYRKEIKKPIKSGKTLESLVKKFEEMNLRVCEQVVNASIENQWQGLFWDKAKISEPKSHLKIDL